LNVSRRFAILVCRGPECGDKRDSASVYAAFETALRDAAPLEETVELGRYSCFGRCRRGPNVLVREILPSENPTLVRLMPTAGPRAVLYYGVRPDEAARVIEEHVRKGNKLEDLATRNAPETSGLDPL
jgi:(2Fe-2S) ferredoxin